MAFRQAVHVLSLSVTLYLLKVFSCTISILGSEPIPAFPFTPAQFFPTSSSLWNNSKTRFFAKFGIEELLRNTSSNNVCGYPFGGSRIELGVDEEDVVVELGVVGALGVVVVGIAVEILDVVGNASKEFGVVKDLGVEDRDSAVVVVLGVVGSMVCPESTRNVHSKLLMSPGICGWLLAF